MYVCGMAVSSLPTFFSNHFLAFMSTFPNIIGVTLLFGTLALKEVSHVPFCQRSAFGEVALLPKKVSPL
jgi:hypothetical protein